MLLNFQKTLVSTRRYAILYWTPLIIYELLGDSFEEGQRAWVVALLTGIPFSIAAGATMLVGKHSKKTGELQRHVWVPMAVAGVALFFLSVVLTKQPLLAFALLVPSTLLWSNEGVFMSWPRTFLHGAAAATGVALINSVGNCGGMVGPYVLGMPLQMGCNSVVLCVALLPRHTCLVTCPLPRHGRF